MKVNFRIKPARIDRMLSVIILGIYWQIFEARCVVLPELILNKQGVRITDNHAMSVY